MECIDNYLVFLYRHLHNGGIQPACPFGRLPEYGLMCARSYRTAIMVFTETLQRIYLAELEEARMVSDLLHRTAVLMQTHGGGGLSQDPQLQALPSLASDAFLGRG